MGALYAKAHATNAAVALAYRGFLERMDRYLPVRGAGEPHAIATLLASRFPAAAREPGALAGELAACEAARWAAPMPAGRALTLVRVLHDVERTVYDGLKPAQPNTEANARTRG